MPIRRLTSPADLDAYDAWLQGHPQGSLWQSRGWEKFQRSLGRHTAVYAALEDGRITASALVVIDRTSLGYSTWDIPRGPLVSEPAHQEPLLQAILSDASREKCLALILSPLVPLPSLPKGAEPSGRHVQPEATRIIDLRPSEEEILAQMKQKGRYNIRLAEKHGVEVRVSEDIGPFAALMTETARRDGFRAHGAAYYGRFLTDLPGSFLLLAFLPGQENPLAGLLGTAWDKTGIYYYGASDHAHRMLMAPYLLQWAAMRRCRDAGSESYDLFGIAPDGAADHPWSTVSDFKAKFGGTVIAYPPERQFLLRPLTQKALSLKRRILG